jgi:ParB family transcriptional regulator, chromosome partitioning protein
MNTFSNLNAPARPLGRGLSSLIPRKTDNFAAANRQPVSAASYLPKNNAGVSNQIFYIHPAEIVMNPYQPRQNFDQPSLENLKNSIREHGIIQPLVVTQTMGGKYELIAGERRLRAARDLGMKKVPVIVRTAKDLEKLELSLIENIQREDLNPIEKAESYQQLIDNFHLTQEEAAKRLGIARSTLNNTLRLLQLPDDIQHALVSGRLSEGQAKLILSLNDAKEQERIFHKIKDNNFTVKDVEREVKHVKVKSYTRETKKDPQLKAWESEMQSVLGTKVAIRKRGFSGGVVEIEFYSEEDLRGIVENITG